MMKVVVVLACVFTVASGAAAKCVKDDGVAAEAKAPADGCFCGGEAESADNPKCGADKYCAKTRDGKFKCLDAKLTDKCGADAENADKDVCGCEKEGAADVFVELCIKTDTCQKADGKCKAKAAAAAKCKKDDGVHDDAKAPAEKCFCGGEAKSDANPECEADKYCAKTRDGKFTCLAAKLTDACAQDAANADKDVCGCKKGDEAAFVELCIKTDTCQKADGKCKAAAGAATTTTTKKATTKAAGATTKAAAATTAAASATTLKPLSAADAAKVAEAQKAAGTAHDAVAKAMETFDVAAAATAIKGDAAVKALAGADMSAVAINKDSNTKVTMSKVKMDESNVKDAATAQKTGEVILKAAGVATPAAFTCTFVAARRVEARSLAAKEYTMTANLKSKAAYQAEVGAAKTAELQKAAAASGSGSSGASHMAGVAAVAALFFF